MRRLNLPRVGRYRLYDLLPAAHLRCRLCGVRIRMETAWGHWGREVDRLVVDRGDGEWLVKAEARMAERLRTVLLRRRSARHRRHGQYEHETGGRYD